MKPGIDAPIEHTSNDIDLGPTFNAMRDTQRERRFDMREEMRRMQHEWAIKEIFADPVLGPILRNPYYLLNRPRQQEH